MTAHGRVRRICKCRGEGFAHDPHDVATAKRPDTDAGHGRIAEHVARAQLAAAAAAAAAAAVAVVVEVDVPPPSTPDEVRPYRRHGS